MLKSRGGKNKEEGEKEFGDMRKPKGVKPWTDTQIEEEAIVDSQSSSGKRDTQMSGESMKEPETCLATEEMKEGRREDTNGKEKGGHIGRRKEAGLCAV